MKAVDVRFGKSPGTPGARPNDIVIARRGTPFSRLQRVTRRAIRRSRRGRYHDI